MNVDVLLMHLSNMSHFLREAGATKPADQLREVCDILRPLQGKRLKDLVNDMHRAEEILRNPNSGLAKKSGKISLQDFEILSTRLVNLYERAGRPGLTREEIEKEFADPKLFLMTENQLKDVASKLGIQKVRGKDKLLSSMRQIVLARMGALERVDA